MLTEISSHIRQILTHFTEDDSIIFNNTLYKINNNNFQEIIPQKGKSITFIDGGQAEILSTGNFCLSFIRIVGITFKDKKKIQSKKEFYLFTKAVYKNKDLIFESKIFGDKLIEEADLIISSNDQTIKTSIERASIAKVSNIARRFAELALAKIIKSDFILLDGTLEQSYPNEEKYLSSISALAKSSSLFTSSGNSPVILLNKIVIDKSWIYQINERTFFVKLHPKAKHVFRFDGNTEILPFLTENSKDALFLGYPYGLILADKQARITNEEKNSLAMQFLLRKENQEIANYLNSINAHEILDQLSY
ncbi:MAG TPA: hypothetical protein VJI98_02170 [Candidatus Nanoarchaeia archaeon]|nr:hypothetical protein [Candidatus Nanoarchaeia archaeon]